VVTRATYMWRHSSSWTRAAVENIKYAADVHLLEFNVQEYVAASSSVGVLFQFCFTSCMRRSFIDHKISVIYTCIRKFCCIFRLDVPTSCSNIRCSLIQRVYPQFCCAFLCVALQPKSDLGCLVFEFSGLHTIRHTHPFELL